MENNPDSQEQTPSTIIVNPQKDLNNLNANIALSNNNTDIHEDSHHC
jgi:hypothetical protein